MDVLLMLVCFFGILQVVQTALTVYSNISYQNSIPNPDWVELGENYYFFSNQTKTSYYKASKTCRSVGSELVSITSVLERNLIAFHINNTQSLFSLQFWVGLYKKTLNDQFYFLDGNKINKFEWIDIIINQDEPCMITSMVNNILTLADKKCYSKSVSFICKLPKMEKVISSKFFKKILEGQYVRRNFIKVAPNNDCSLRNCVLMCLPIQACYGFNLRKHSSGACRCQLRGSESYLDRPIQSENGSSFWQ